MKKNNPQPENKTHLIYSTDPDYLAKINLEAAENEKIATLPPHLQPLRFKIDRSQRKGKEVVLISGFVGEESDLIELSKTIKTKCGVGGSVKNGEIIIQGDVLTKITELLAQLGYTKAKKG